MRLSWNEIRARAAAFAEDCYGKGETQSFHNAFFDVVRGSAPERWNIARYGAHVAKLGNRSGFIDQFWPGVLIVNPEKRRARPESGLPTPPPPAPKAPAVPENLTATAGEGFVEWSWTAVEGVRGYSIEISANDNTFEPPDSSSLVSDATKFRHQTTKPMTVFARIRAVAGTTDNPLYSEYSKPVSGTSTAPAEIPAPSNFKATSGKGFVEWSWEPVAGARGYYIQISADNKSFDPPDSFSLVSKNSYRFQTSKPTTVFARVRTAAGTLTKPLYSSYTDPVSAKSDETPPPPAVKLDTPDNVSARTPTINSAIISWDEVDDADTYEIQLRTGSGAWSKATCTGTTNPTSNTTCTASGLTHSTQYDFRVRAIPDDDDKTHSTSNWSDTAESTTLVKPTTPATTTTTTGAGDLKITWRSDANSITWRWNQGGDNVDYQVKPLDGVVDSNAPCEDRSVDWDSVNPSLQNSHEVSGLSAGDSRVLCVRTTWIPAAGGDRQYGKPSWVWAAMRPSPPTRPSDPVEVDDDGVTTSLKWGGLTLAGNGQIQYEFRYLVDPQNTEKKEVDDDEHSDQSKVQLQCVGPASKPAETITPRGSTRTEYRTKGTLTPYSKYYLCYRAFNQHGRSNWRVSQAAYYTAPAKVSVSTKSNVRGASTDTITSVGEASTARDTPQNYHILQWNVKIPANAPRISATNILDYFDVVASGSGAKGATGSGTPKTDKPISKSDLDTLSNVALTDKSNYHYLISSGDTDTTTTAPLPIENRLFVGVSIAYGVIAPPNVDPRTGAAFGSLKRTSETAFVVKFVAQGQDGSRQYNHICVRAKYHEDISGDGATPGPWICAGLLKGANKK